MYYYLLIFNYVHLLTNIEIINIIIEFALLFNNIVLCFISIHLYIIDKVLS